MRRQIMTVHVRADQKPAQGNHPLQVSPANLGVPSDPSIPILKLQGRRPKPHCTKEAMLGADQIAKLPPHKGSRPRGCSRIIFSFPGPHLVCTLHNDKLQSSHIADCAGMGLWSCNRLKKTSRTPTTHGPISSFTVACRGESSWRPERLPRNGNSSRRRTGEARRGGSPSPC